jgi:hypothetical protein
VQKNKTEGIFRNRSVWSLENDDSEGQSNGLSELDWADCELEFLNNECAIAVGRIRQGKKGLCKGIRRGICYIL